MKTSLWIFLALTFSFSLTTLAADKADKTDKGGSTKNTPCSVGDTPYMTIKSSSGKAVFLCGYEEAHDQTPKGKVHMTYFALYSPPDGNIFESSGQIDNFWVSRPRNNEFLVEELVVVRGKFVPFYEFSLVCTSKSCDLSPKKCTFHMKNPYPKVVDDIVDFANSKDTEPLPNYDAMIEQAGVQALSGDEKALNLFTDDYRKKLKADGAAAQEYARARRNLKLAREAGCLAK